MKTIVALASAVGQGGVAVIRLSGDRLSVLAQQLTGIEPKPRYAHFVSFKSLAGELLDQGLLLWFPAPHSYTGEDVLELHTHGGEIAPQRVLEACLALGAQPAAPGDFTRRAFLNGKLTLAQAEAVADLIGAHSELAAQGAVRSLVGVFSDQVRSFQKTLTTIRVELESGFDFPEEGIDAFPAARIRERVGALINTLNDWLENGQRWVRLQAGISIAIVGAPNVGKSSLINSLAEESLAIVSDEPGTTRDSVRVHLNLAGFRVELTDTAGIRETENAIEKLGIERSTEVARQADLVLWLRSDDVDDSTIPSTLPSTVEWVEVWNKSDRFENAGRLSISAKTGQGLDQLKSEILSRLRNRLGVEPAFMPRIRHLTLLSEARTHLERAIAPGLAEEYIAEELRAAQKALDPVLGEFASDDLLGQIFSTFCIGK